MDGILDKLTDEQRVILKQFRKNLKDILTPEHTDYALLKFLRAKDFNLKQSEKIFRTNFNNRITFGINTILETYEKPEVVKRCEASGILGIAKNGTVIHYIPCGRLDFYGYIMSMSCSDLCLYFSHMMDTDIQLQKEECQRSEKDIQEVTYILDLEGFTLQQVLHKCVIEMGIDFASLLQDCYPEVWCDVLIINAPRIFNKAFNIFKPVLKTNVLDRIQLVDKSSSKDLLLKYIDENVLPASLGGKRVDSNGDPMCREFISFGGKVPEKLYSQHHRIPLTPSDPDVKCVTIRPRSMYNLSVVVQEPGSTLRLQMRSENGSILITIFFKEFGVDANNEELPAEDEYLDETAENFKYKQISVDIRVQAHCTQEDSTIDASLPGIYVFRLSNARSWFTSRKILIKYEAYPPRQKRMS